MAIRNYIFKVFFFLGLWTWNLGLVSCFLFLGTLSFAQNPSLTRGPYLHVGTSNSVIIRWRTDTIAPVNSRVWYGSQPDTSGMAYLDSASLTTEHEVNITGLSPHTKYFY